jgi:hypothetical protein
VKSPFDGVIAIDVTAMIYDPGFVLQAASFRSAHFQVSNVVAESLRQEAPGIRRHVDVARVIALAFYAAVLVRESGNGDAGYVRGWTFANLCEANDPRWASIGQIAERMNVASFLRTG